MADPAILIVDDEPDIRKLLAMTLRKLGVEASCAEDIAAARALLDKQEFQFCITDMKLPDGSGITADDALRRAGVRAANPRRGGFPVSSCVVAGRMTSA